MVGVDEIAGLISELVSIRSETGRKEDINRAAEWVANFGRNAGLSFEVFESHGVPSVVLSNRLITKSCDVILHGHIDVVQGKDEDFIPRRDGDLLYGRGTCDMKAGVVACLLLLREYRGSKSIQVMVTGDEEVGGQNGARYLLHDLGFRSKLFLTAEGERAYLLKIKQKGVVKFRMQASGVGEHASYTWKGKNAILSLIDGYRTVAALFPEERNDPDHWYSTINLGTISGGQFAGAVPERAECDIDVRFTEAWECASKVIDAIRHAVDGRGIVIEELFSAELMLCHDQSQMQCLNDICRRRFSLTSDLFFSNHGTNDARFAAEVGIPAVGFGPIGANYHAKGEYVNLESVREWMGAIADFLERNE